jgi:hypothetical protein
MLHKRGGKRASAGRKSLEVGQARTVVKQVRWTPEEWAAIEKARRDGCIVACSASEFIRRAVLSFV